jgi:hypothetical protein
MLRASSIGGIAPSGELGYVEMALEHITYSVGDRS